LLSRVEDRVDAEIMSLLETLALNETAHSAAMERFIETLICSGLAV